jgi:hypothetical protein
MLEVPSSVHPTIKVKFSNPRAPFTNINDQGVFGENVSKKNVEKLRQINRNSDVA